ncbi:hypothetical protein Tco_0477960 [Tanacetum coccineum]
MPLKYTKHTDKKGTYTSDMCMQSWGRSSYARAMIELRADVELKDNIVVAMPKITGEGFYTCNIRVEYEWKPHSCACCKVFGHVQEECPKNIGAGETKNLKKPSQTPKGVLVGRSTPDERVFPTAVAWRTSAPKDSMPLEGTYSVEDVAILNARRTPIQKQPETLIRLVGLAEILPEMDLGREQSDQSASSTCSNASGARAPFSVYAAPRRSSKGTTAAGGPEPDPTSPTMVVSPGSIYQPEWGVTNGCRLDTPSSCQELVDHLAPPGYFSELRHLPNEDFLGQFNMTLARQVAMGSQLRGYRFEQIPKLLRKSVAQLKEKAAEAKNAELVKEMESLRGEEKIKAVFEEFKKYEDERVSARCAETDSRLDALSINFDEELYPHMLTAIAGRRWVIWHGLRMAVLKCAESLELRQTFANVVSTGITKGFCNGLKYGVEQEEAKLDLAMVEGYDPEAEGKFIATMQALKDLKYPLIDELEKLRDAPMDVLMASLYLESDTGGDVPQWIRTSEFIIVEDPGVP